MFYILEYNEQYKEKWDEFVQTDSINGTFLQTRKFIEYHPKDRFEDSSLIILDEKNAFAATILACNIYDINKKIFMSHKGSTFGGLVIRKKYYKADKIEEMLALIENYFIENNYNKAIMKQTSTLFSKERTDLVEYMLTYNGYIEKIELSNFINYSEYEINILSNFAQSKRTHVKKCESFNWELNRVTHDYQIKEIYDILSDNLKKYQTKPVHTFKELIKLKSLFNEEIDILTLTENGKIIAGAVVFYFSNTNSVHLQYSCADNKYDKYSAMTYLYYKLIELYSTNQKRYFSFGISTENMGEKINFNLLKSKEQFGSKYCNNRTFIKNFGV